MTWPPVKAWTSISSIDGQIHFVALNYGGKLSERWVILMSVLDSCVVVRVPWSQLIDPSNWECGWVNKKYSNSSKLVNNKVEIRNTNYTHISTDSGLTMPITKKKVRPWFANI
tara:strand:- start:685 stop:1023 length:339 start_codon:yes stop_codon:yes gene_type:complete